MSLDFLSKPKNWYIEADQRVLLAVSLIVLFIFSGLLYVNHQRTGEWFQKGLDLKGGKELSISRSNVPDDITPSDIEKYLLDNDIESQAQMTSSVTGGNLLVKVPLQVNETRLLDLLQERGIKTSDYSFSEVGPAVAESLLKQSQLALIVAFIFMAVTVFIVFRDFVPSIAIVFAAFMDIIGTLSVMQVFNIPLSLASFAGLLLVVGYSIDSDIVLTTRVLKRKKGSVSDRTISAMKTSLTMTITTLSALFVLYIATTAQALRQVAIVLMIALLIDLLAT
ncbi:MAG: hypothetical protein ABEJ72_00215 [Candidatus Aenigmatarchaeota archaeon]